MRFDGKHRVALCRYIADALSNSNNSMGISNANTKTLIVSFVTISLVGCSTNAQIESGRINQAGIEATARSKACTDRVTAKADYAGLREKLHLEATEQVPLAKLTDRSKPSALEIKAYYALYGELQKCRQILLDESSKAHPLIHLTFINGFTEIDKLATNFVAGQMSWGEFNAARDREAKTLKASLLDAQMKIHANLAQHHQYEVEQRQRAAAAMQQWAYQQQVLANQQSAINAMNKPLTTNCNRFGSSVQCTTQ